MGRKNLTEERTTMILDAFERCVAKNGLDGTSLEQVASEVGFRRGLVRHYLGNREAMILALAERSIARYREQVDEMLAWLPENDLEPALLDLFFPEQSQASTADLLVMEHLIAAGPRYPTIQEGINQWLEEFVTKLAHRLSKAFPHGDQELFWPVSYGLISIYFNQESLHPLGLPSKYNRGARQCAATLLASLKT